MLICLCCVFEYGRVRTLPSIDKSERGFSGLKQRSTLFSSLPGDTPTEDDDDVQRLSEPPESVSVRRVCPLPTDGIV